MTTLRAGFKKTVSDGNFGSEVAEVILEVENEVEGPDDEDLTDALLRLSRRLVHAELARSPSATVRRVLAMQAARPTPPPPLEPEDEGDELPAHVAGPF